MKFRSLLFYLALSGGLMWVLYEFFALPLIVSWFGAVNVVLFLLMGKDKGAAKTGMGRTPEFTLLGLALAGGFPGMFAARKVFNHKTTKASFVLTMWLLFFAQLGLSAWYFGDLEKLGFKRKQPTTAATSAPAPATPAAPKAATAPR